jgi:hypothetical protein
VSLCFSSSGLGGFFLVEGAVAENGVNDVATAPSETDDGGVVLLSLVAFLLVVGLGEIHKQVVKGTLEPEVLLVADLARKPRLLANTVENTDFEQIVNNMADELKVK